MGTVTIGKEYFETLVRRAQSHSDGEDLTTPLHLATVTIQKSEHDKLLDVARKFANLQRNLVSGGVVQETLAILTQDDGSADEIGRGTTYCKAEEKQENIAPLPAPGRQSFTYGRNAANTNDHASSKAGTKWHGEMKDTNSYDTQDAPDDGFFDEESGPHDCQQVKSGRPEFEKFAKRSILIHNLPENVTHADIIDVVRGGLVLDVYLRTNDRAASVSFLESASAQKYFRHVKRHDLYVKGKRVEIRWNDRQFILPGHVANKVSIGATRNLVVRDRSPRITEESIREDLEHIHNLVIVKVTFDDRNVYISTNSVHNSMFARTCMMSRAAYKGHKIEWGDDECAGPLTKPEAYSRPAPKIVKDAPLLNRFELLGMVSMDESEDEDDADTSLVTLQSFAPSTIAV